MPKKITTKEFIIKAKKVYGDLYDYSKVLYKEYTTKITIVCSKHGEFRVSPANHLNSNQGCPVCSKENSSRLRKKDKSYCLNKFEKVHGDRYDYSKFKYVNNREKSVIICKEHGEFLQSADVHYKGHGCPKCAIAKNSNNQARTKEQFLTKAKEVHTNKYEYPNLGKVTNNSQIEVLCEEHGVFTKSVKNHLKGQGCPICSKQKMNNNRKKDTQYFIEKSREIHGDTYDYSNSVYTRRKDDINIICKKHGVIPINAGNHMQGHGCPKCGTSRGISKPEEELAEFIKDFLTIEESNRTILGTKELDIYVPSKKVAIEFDGLYWHSDRFKDKRYHLEKTIGCNEKGVKLIHVFEDEWNYKKEQVKSRIKNILGVSETRIYARRTEIKEVPTKEAMVFLDNNHLQGRLGGKVKLGLYYDNELVSLMTFGKLRKNLGSAHKEGHYELLRFCNKLDTSVVGGFSKLLKHFKETEEYVSLISYADRRWSEGNVYEINGFNKLGETVPNYFYAKKGKREARFKYRKDILVSEGYDKNKTEKEIMKDRGYDRVYDCGTLKYEMV